MLLNKLADLSFKKWIVTHRNVHLSQIDISLIQNCGRNEIIALHKFKTIQSTSRPFIKNISKDAQLSSSIQVDHIERPTMLRWPSKITEDTGQYNKLPWGFFEWAETMVLASLLNLFSLSSDSRTYISFQDSYSRSLAPRKSLSQCLPQKWSVSPM